MRFILLNLAKPGLIVSATAVWLLAFSLLASPVWAEENAAADQRYLAEFELHTAQEMQAFLLRAEQLMIDGAIPLDGEPRVAFVLHGPEVRILLRKNYLQNKAVVDKAAALSALGVVEIKACRTWMGGDGIDPADLQFFVETVPYGPSEVRRLVERENYINF
jgi:intracellular sulfur oxidation DsrE/DsrF family protein